MYDIGDWYLVVTVASFYIQGTTTVADRVCTLRSVIENI